MSIFRCTISLPPSINTAFIVNVGNKHLYTKPVKEWKENAVKELWVAKTQQKFTTLRTPAHAHLDFYFSNSRCDLNNYLKFIYDAFEEAQIIENDSLFYSELHEKFITDKGQECVDIIICAQDSLEELLEEEGKKLDEEE